MDTTLEKVETAGQGELKLSRLSPNVLAKPLPSVAKSTSLLDLPDELLSSIYEQVYHALRSDAKVDAVGVCVPLVPILVDKRIFSLAKPIFFQHLTFPSPDTPSSDEFLADLLDQTDVHDYVKSVDLQLSPDHPALQLKVLSLLINITRLSLKVLEDHVPRDATNTLKILKKLEHLTLVGTPIEFEDSSFSVNKELPSLRSFEIEDNCFIDRNFAVQRLISRSEVPFIAYPWASMEQLTLRRDGGTLQDVWEIEDMFVGVSHDQVSLFLISFPRSD